ncbi:MAG: FAD-dependent oxidoreductase [Gammaproteobacteria bacterium]|nr:FAD-dependent oxidoreductase [Gammaproteobacteria bacterium]
MSRSEQRTSPENVPKTIIVGGGWAGLSCAVQLAKAQYPFQLYEASRQLGGRARSAKFGQYQIDNGQHILVGACQGTLHLLALIGIDEKAVLHRQSLDLKWRHLNQTEQLHIKAADIIAPFHLLFAILNANGLNLKEKTNIIKFLLYLKIKKFTINQDLTLTNYLKQHSQSERLIDFFWEPMCLAILNTPITKASTLIFFKVLKDSFDQQASYSDSLLFKQKLKK